MPRVAIRARDKFHGMPHLRPQSCRTADPDVAIVGMRAERNDAKLRRLRKKRDTSSGAHAQQKVPPVESMAYKGMIHFEILPNSLHTSAARRAARNVHGPHRRLGPPPATRLILQ
jgi:hypothetical protein